MFNWMTPYLLQEKNNMPIIKEERYEVAVAIRYIKFIDDYETFISGNKIPRQLQGTRASWNT